MPSRSTTAPRAIASILPQIARLWLFLDGFDAVPPYALQERIRVVRSQDLGDIRANGKFAGVALEEAECTFFGVDDDIEYPPDYVEGLASALERYDGAVVGVHAGVLRTPVVSYRDDLKVLHRRSRQTRTAGVDLLGSDSLAFDTRTLRFDPRAWPDLNMVDLSFALEVRPRGIPLVMVQRASHWLRALDENQPDSIWSGLLRDDARQTVLAQSLVDVPRPQLPRNGFRRLAYRRV